MNLEAEYEGYELKKYPWNSDDISFMVLHNGETILYIGCYNGKCTFMKGSRELAKLEYSLSQDKLYEYIILHRLGVDI